MDISGVITRKTKQILKHEVAQFRKCCVGKKDPGVSYPVVHVSVTQQMCDSEISNQAKWDRGLVKV